MYIVCMNFLSKSQFVYTNIQYVHVQYMYMYSTCTCTKYNVLAGISCIHVRGFLAFEYF